MQSLIRKLDLRRRMLGIGYAVLAKRSGVSMPTVVRILSGRHPRASFENVLAIAQALGMEVQFHSVLDVQQLREQQARQKAKRLIGMVQGSFGLEGQALDESARDRMADQAVHELLAGSARRLWSE